MMRYVVRVKQIFRHRENTRTDESVSIDLYNSMMCNESTLNRNDPTIDLQ